MNPSGTEECCPGDKLPNKNCKNDFTWEEIKVINEETGETNVECSDWKPCSGAEWNRDVTKDKTLVKYNCVDNKCVRTEKQVDCTVSSDCLGPNVMCSPIDWTCVQASEVETGGTESVESSRQECLDKSSKQWWMGWSWIESEECGFWCNLGFAQPTKIGKCKADYLKYWIIGAIAGFLIFIIIIIILVKSIGGKPTSYSGSTPYSGGATPTIIQIGK